MQSDATVPTFEDKVAQRAVVMVLEAIYEQDFLPCSYGFRPGRSAHQALQALRTGFMSHGLLTGIDRSPSSMPNWLRKCEATMPTTAYRATFVD